MNIKPLKKLFATFRQIITKLLQKCKSLPYLLPRPLREREFFNVSRGLRTLEKRVRGIENCTQTFYPSPEFLALVPRAEIHPLPQGAREKRTPHALHLFAICCSPLTFVISSQFINPKQQHRKRNYKEHTCNTKHFRTPSCD